MNNKREINLDLMRLLGILIIMIAHASPPAWLFQLRNFGTPLLIVASALTYSTIYSKREMNCLPFYKKRLTRLIIPAWLFLTFFFFIFFITSELFSERFPFSLKQIINSYTFYSGIGFVWVLKIYIILALLTPFALRIRNIKTSNARYFTALSILYVAYELSIKTLSEYIPYDLEGIFNKVIFIIIPYSILYLYGMRLNTLTRKQIKYTAACSLSLFFIIMLTKYSYFGHFIPTQKFKYPPTIYYLSYAFFALNFVYLICNKITHFSKNLSAIIIWLSSNSLWIYLWHIMGYYIWNQFLESIDGSFVFFLLKVCFMLSVGTSATYFQIFIVKKFASEKYFIGRKIISVLT